MSSFAAKYVKLKKRNTAIAWEKAKRNRVCYLFLLPYAVLFFTFFILPMITSIICIIPMLFYDLQGEKRDRMYAELLARRAHIAEVATSGDKDAMAQAAKEQMAVGEKHNK